MRTLLAALKAHARLLRAALVPAPAPLPLPLLLPRGAAAPSTCHHSVPLGAGRVELHVTRFGPAGGGITCVNVHQNEQTSVQAARSVLQARGGRLVELRSQGRRHVSFRSGLLAHTVDPNRIFTAAGLRAALQALGPDTPAARAALCGLRDAVLALLPAPDGRPLVALHNNGGHDYSLQQYAAGGALAADAERLHSGRPAAPSDFFVVTEAWLFEPLAADGFNVVLLSPAAADDGSLSVWAQRAGRPYVNVEALAGRQAEQEAMLAAVWRHFAAVPATETAPRPSSRPITNNEGKAS